MVGDITPQPYLLWHMEETNTFKIYQIGEIIFVTFNDEYVAFLLSMDDVQDFIIEFIYKIHHPFGPIIFN